ncbi:MAG TPA: aminotransferase class I/II-fold pyridoxal phosphate-dependent enzyme [Candidatus Nanopelagicaceae bacterium]|nr:aminotransferase class I/II-fold pyridoxal phosphate-dependent enzyme [Candidatus Nanopelagicaceae bacterium]
MRYDLERYSRAELQGRTGVKWHRDGSAAIAAWVADMDFPIAPEIRAAIDALVSSDDLGYPDPSLDASVRSAFSRRVRARYQLVVDPDRVVVVSDVVQAIYVCVLAFTEPGDGIACLTPAYPPFFSAVADTGRRLLACDLVAGEERFEVDLAALDSLLRDQGARMLLLCNPHNPTGRSFTRAELEGIAAIARDRDLTVISDEIHADLTLAGATHLAFGALDSASSERTVTLSSASKAFNLAGLRCAVAAFGSDSLRDRFERFPAHARGSVSVLGMVAALAAWEGAGAWLEAALRALSSNRDFLVAYLAQHLPRVAIRPPEATYLAWLDLRPLGLGDDPAGWLKEHAKVALSPGADFGASGSGHSRLNFGTTRPVLEEMLARIAAALA